MKILITGDFCPIGRNADLIRDKDYKSLFNGFESITSNVDYAIVNLECPVTNSTKKISKTGPCIKTEDNNVFEALRFAGFDLLTLANNHILDYDEVGVTDTIKRSKYFGFDSIGAGANIDEAKKAIVKDIKGKKVGFLNIAENEFCASTKDSAGAYTFDLIDNLRQISNLKQKVDKVILIYHGGREHYQLPSPEQRKRFRFFIENGVDAIVAHHTHCVSGFEYYCDKPIVYSLGNFIFDYKKKYQKGKWTEGMSVILRLEDENFKVELIPHRQGQVNDSTLSILENSEKAEFLENVQSLNKIIQDDELFNFEWKRYLESQEKFYLSSMYIRNKYLRFLFMKGIFPISILKSKHNILMLNLMRCEAHHEISQGVLSK